jgi:hypothetical protein
MRDALLKLIHEGEGDRSEGSFNALARQIYQYQFEHNRPYRQFCLTQDKAPEKISRWEEIPALPVTAFASVSVVCQPIENASRIFYSSGTTRGMGATVIQRSCHALFDEEIAKAAILSHFKKKILPEGAPLRFCILTPSPQEAPNSSLSYMMEVLREAFGAKESDYYIHHDRLLADHLAYQLSSADTPVLLLGTSFSFVHFIDFLVERNDPILLPPGSRIMDTGGFKGKSRTVSSHWLYAMIEKLLGIPAAYCVNEYGMAEMTSQFYDGIAGVPHPRVHYAPPQTRFRILSPETLKPLPSGEIGLVAIYDLANIDSALAILTEDLGREVNGGIEVVGRATGAGLKGCSVDMDILLGSS